ITISGTPTQSGTFTYSIPLTGGCGTVNATGTIIVNPEPFVVDQTKTICSDVANGVILGDDINGPAVVSYNIIDINIPVMPLPIIASAGNPIVGVNFDANEIVDDAWTNTNTVPINIAYTVVPVSADGCEGNSFTVTLTINPEPLVVDQVRMICSDIANGVILGNDADGPAAVSYNIIDINIPVMPVPIIASAGNAIVGVNFDANEISDDAWTNTNTVPVNIVYTVVPVSASGCEGNPFTVTITVESEFVISDQSITVCSDSTNSIILGSEPTATYTITNIVSNDLMASSGNPQIGSGFSANEIANDAWTNMGTAPIVVVYTVIPQTSSGCSGNPVTITLTINPEPFVINQTTLICNDEPSNIILTNDVDGPNVTSYIITNINSNGLTPSGGNPNLGTITSINEIADDAWKNTTLAIVPVIYDITPVSADGCLGNTFTITLNVNPQINIGVTTTPITCYGANNASITLSVTGGTGPYQAQWDNLATGFYQNNLAAGDYTILITDSVGCTKSIVVNIPEAPIFTINPVVVNISCYGANDGSINLNLVGGIAPINLTWSDGSTAGLVRNNLPPGIYTVTIVDSKPCTITRSFTIVEPQPLVLSANLQNALDCNDANSGSINLLVSGGTPPFTYSWSNGTITEDLNNIPAGNYAVLVTDSRGCTKSAQYSINRPQPLALNVETNTDVNCETREISQVFEAQVSGGVPPVLLSWSSGTVSGANNEFMTTEQDGLVILTATDALGCSTTYSLNVDIPVIGNAGFNQSSYGYTAYGIYSILDPIQFTNTATGDYVSILWDFGDGTFSNEENPIHTYILEGDYVVTQTVTYPFGCVYVHTISLIIEKGYVLVVPTAFTPNNDTLNDTFRPVTRGLKNVRMDVYDTWGSLIYSETGDVLRGWDGTIRGIQSENGNYNCKVSAETFYGKIITAEETFVLIK
ncbi:MAG: PKD domain-containing protein, partial [Flavobacteriia bacterium]